jgi:hypothetical protein
MMGLSCPPRYKDNEADKTIGAMATIQWVHSTITLLFRQGMNDSHTSLSWRMDFVAPVPNLHSFSVGL